MSGPAACILHADIPADAPGDEQDVLDEAAAVKGALCGLGYAVETVTLTLDLSRAAAELERLRPRFVFNLVESVAGAGKLIHLAPALLEHLGIPFTGCGTAAMFLTTDKVIAKERMVAAGIPTPAWHRGGGDIPFDPPYIVKPSGEDASVGLDDDIVVRTRSAPASPPGTDVFTEQYVDGREFNISLMDDGTGPQLLPAAEMTFVDFPPDKPRIVGYRAKWDADSFEYTHTVRRFDFPGGDAALLEKINGISRRCWDLFGLSGYARVDIRCTAAEEPLVLEVNANPCITPDSGLVAAAARAGMEYPALIGNIVNAALAGTHAVL